MVGWHHQVGYEFEQAPGVGDGQVSLACCRSWGHKDSNTTERLHFHLSLSCIGEGNGNPLQCSWLENPRDQGGWWAAVYGVAQSRTRLKRLSSSSSSSIVYLYPSLSFLSLSTVQLSDSAISDSLGPHGLQHSRLSCPSPTPGACSNSCALSQ